MLTLSELIEILAAEILFEVRDLEGLELTVDQVVAWKKKVEELLAEYSLAAYMSGAETTNLTSQDLQKVATAVDTQRGFLDGFVTEIVDRDEFDPAWEERAQQYADSVTVPYWEGKVGMLPLPAMPGEGTQCGGRCQCKWDIIPVEDGYDCYWRLGEVDHCQTCVQRASDWNPLEIRNGIVLMERHVFKGGSGSGNFGHAGRPGEIGGSSERGGFTNLERSAQLYSQVLHRGSMVADASQKLIRGESLDPLTPSYNEAASDLVRAIRQAPPQDTTLYRTVTFKRQGEDEDRIAFRQKVEALKPGDTLSLDRISSFSSDRQHAAFFGTADKGWKNIEFRLVGDSKSFGTDELAGMGQKEFITEGLFEVVDIQPGDRVHMPEGYRGYLSYDTIITLKQLEVY